MPSFYNVKYMATSKSVSPLTLLIVGTLTTGDKYGLEIIDVVYQASKGCEIIRQPSLYSTLKKLSVQKIISTYWRDSELGGKRHYNHLTDYGKKMFEHWLESTALPYNFDGIVPHVEGKWEKTPDGTYAPNYYFQDGNEVDGGPLSVQVESAKSSAVTEELKEVKNEVKEVKADAVFLPKTQPETKSKPAEVKKETFAQQESFFSMLKKKEPILEAFAEEPFENRKEKIEEIAVKPAAKEQRKEEPRFENEMLKPAPEKKFVKPQTSSLSFAEATQRKKISFLDSSLDSSPAERLPQTKEESSSAPRIRVMREAENAIIPAKENASTAVKKEEKKDDAVFITEKIPATAFKRSAPAASIPLLDIEKAMATSQTAQSSSYQKMITALYERRKAAETSCENIQEQEEPVQSAAGRTSKSVTPRFHSHEQLADYYVSHDVGYNIYVKRNQSSRASSLFILESKLNLVNSVLLCCLSFIWSLVSYFVFIPTTSYGTVIYFLVPIIFILLVGLRTYQYLSNRNRKAWEVNISLPVILFRFAAILLLALFITAINLIIGMESQTVLSFAHTLIYPLVLSSFCLFSLLSKWTLSKLKLMRG